MGNHYHLVGDLRSSPLHGVPLPGATSSKAILTAANCCVHLPASGELHVLQMTWTNPHTQLMSGVCVNHLNILLWATEMVQTLNTTLSIFGLTWIDKSVLGVQVFQYQGYLSPLKPSSTFFLMMTWSPMMWSPNTSVSMRFSPPLFRAWGASSLHVGKLCQRGSCQNPGYSR